MAHMGAGALALSALDVVSKLVITEMPVVQMLTLRAAAVLVLLPPWLWRAGGVALFRSGRVALHALRFACQLISVVCSFQALGCLPLAMFVSLWFTGPLLVAALSWPVLGERVGRWRWAAVILGFAGTVAVIDPAAAMSTPVVLLPIVSALGWGIGSVLSWRLAETESDATIMIYLNTLNLVGLALIAPLSWSPAGIDSSLLCGALGVLVLAAQWLALRASRLAPVAAASPLQYLQLPAGALCGWPLRSEWPGANVEGGALVIIGSGIAIAWHERRPDAPSPDGMAAAPTPRP